MNYFFKFARGFYKLTRILEPLFVAFIFQWLIYLNYLKTGRFIPLLIGLNFLTVMAFLGLIIECNVNDKKDEEKLK